MGVRAGMVGVVKVWDGEACSMHGNHQRLVGREGGMEGGEREGGVKTHHYTLVCK